MFEDYVIQRWHTVLLAYFIALVATAVNIYGPHLLDKISKAILIWNILSFLIVVIVILAVNDHKQTGRFVFSEFENFTGFNSSAFVAILGLLQSAFGMCCYDAPAHMVEEMNNASREAPKVARIPCLFLYLLHFIVVLKSNYSSFNSRRLLSCQCGSVLLPV